MQIANDFSNHSSITKFSITRMSFNHKFFIKNTQKIHTHFVLNSPHLNNAL